MLKIHTGKESQCDVLSGKELEINNLYEIMAVSPGSESYIGSVVVVIEKKIYEINDFSDSWDAMGCSFKFRKFKKGDCVTLAQD